MVDETKKKMTILFLLCDPDHVLSRVIQNKFKKEAEWESIVATTYEEALDAYKKNDPDGVITGLLFTTKAGKTGFDLIKEIRLSNKRTRPIPIIVFTELSQPEDKKRAEESGATAYFVKSEMTILEVIEEVKKIMHNQ